jgi:hypothetical protein
MTPEERIAKLESETAKTTEKGKDGWDKFGIACAALIPVAITGVGGLYSYLSQKAATEVARIQAESESTIRQSDKAAESRIKQAELVLKFFEPLMGSDRKRSEFAVQSLLLAAPDYGPVLVRVVAADTKAPAEAAYAAGALSERRDSLVRQMFSDEANQRVEAYQQLLASWGSDESLISAVIEHASNNTSNGNGIYNSLVLLSHMQRDTIQKQNSAILTFAKLVEGNGDKIRERAEVLRSRLGA